MIGSDGNWYFEKQYRFLTEVYQLRLLEKAVYMEMRERRTLHKLEKDWGPRRIWLEKNELVVRVPEWSERTGIPERRLRRLIHAIAAYGLIKIEKSRSRYGFLIRLFEPEEIPRLSILRASRLSESKREVSIGNQREMNLEQKVRSPNVAQCLAESKSVQHIETTDISGIVKNVLSECLSDQDSKKEYSKYKTHRDNSEEECNTDPTMGQMYWNLFDISELERPIEERAALGGDHEVFMLWALDDRAAGLHNISYQTLLP